MTLKTLDTSQLTHFLFPIHAFHDNRALQASLQSYGQLQPILIAQVDGQTIVVDGVQRLQALKDLSIAKVQCLEVDANLSVCDLFEMWFDLHQKDTHWNAIEQSRMLELAESLYDKVPSWFWKKVSFKKNIRVIHLIRDLVKLPQNIQKHIAQSDYSPFVAAQFLRLPKDDLEKTSARLFQLPLNQNRLGEILQLLADVSLSQEKKPSEIIDEIFKESKQDLPQKKEAHLRQALKSLKNPRYSQVMQEFEENSKSLALPQGAQIQSAPYFEDDYITLQTRIRNEDDLKLLVNSLQSEKILKLLWWR